MFYVLFINSLSVSDTHKPQQPAIMLYESFRYVFLIFFLLCSKLWHAPRVSPEGISRADNSHNILHILVRVLIYRDIWESYAEQMNLHIQRDIQNRKHKYFFKNILILEICVVSKPQDFSYCSTKYINN